MRSDDHADDDLVGDQLTGLHVALCLQPQLGPFGHLGAQHVAGGDVREGEVRPQTLGLGALAGPGRAEQD